jgi:hypothetical protein
MARAPQARAPQASAGDDFYEEIEGDEGAGDRGQDGQEGSDLSEGSPEYAGAEQEAGLGEDVGEFEDDPPQLTRGENRHQRLANENERLRRELEETRRAPRQDATQQPPAQRRETQQEFEARIALLPPDERMEQRHIRWEQTQEERYAQQQQQTAAQQIQQAVERDRASYELEAKTDQRMARFADRVEQEFQKRLRQGQPVARKDLFYWLVGQQVAGVNGKGLQRQRQAAQQRVDRQTVRPARAGSDVQPGRRGQLTEAQARARRLENMQI